MKQGRASKGLIVLGASLLAVNFGFDWWRRFEFDAEKRTITELKDHLLTKRDEIEMLLFRLDGRHHEQEKLIDGLMNNLKDLEALTKHTSSAPQSTAQPIPLVAVEAGREPKEKILSESLFDTPIDVILSERKEKTEKLRRDAPQLWQYYGKDLVMHPDRWNLNDLILKCEEWFGASIPEEDKPLLRLKMETYRHATAAAWSKYHAARTIATMENIEKGDFERPDADGDFQEYSTEVQKEIFASTDVPGGNISWFKSQHPELHRMSEVPNYITLVMLEELFKEFERRKS